MTSNNIGGPSATLLVEQNGRKHSVTQENLNPAQKQAVDDLQEQLHTGSLHNIVGTDESAKTEVGWFLVASNSDWAYYPWLPVTGTVDATTVVVDNVPPTRAASRRAREIRTFTAAKTVVVLSEQAIPEAASYVHLAEYETQ